MTRDVLLSASFAGADDAAPAATLIVEEDPDPSPIFRLPGNDIAAILRHAGSQTVVPRCALGRLDRFLRINIMLVPDVTTSRSRDPELINDRRHRQYTPGIDTCKYKCKSYTSPRATAAPVCPDRRIASTMRCPSYPSAMFAYGRWPSRMARTNSST